LPVDSELPVWREHERDLIEREAGGASQRDQRQPFENAGIEYTVETPPADRSDQPFLLIEPQRRGREARVPGHFRYVHSLSA